MIRISSIIPFLFFSLFLSAQDSGTGYDKAILKKLRVKSQSVYSIKSETDSALTAASFFDTSGNISVTVRYGPDGTIWSKDSFVYNIKGLQVKRISVGVHEGYTESIMEYDSAGRSIRQTVRGDSVNGHSITIYDPDGKHLVTKNYLNLDTSFGNVFFNSKGQIIKTVINGASGETVNKRTYNSSGRVVKIKMTSPGSEMVSFRYYNEKGQVVKTKSISKYNGRENIIESVVTYYPYGLEFQVILYINNKQSGTDRFFYTFYGE